LCTFFSKPKLDSGEYAPKYKKWGMKGDRKNTIGVESFSYLMKGHEMHREMR
jgi:hypothetical protein